MSDLPDHTPVETTSAGRKYIARQFLELVSVGRIDEAYQKYIVMEGRHHNLFFAAGFPTLQEAMKANFIQFPDMRMTIKNVIGEGDMVAVHSHVIMRPSEPGLATVHLFRFQGDRIVEMWDIGQLIPSESINQDGPF